MRAHRATREIPNASAITLENAGHLVHEADPERVARVFYQFQERLN